jgi:undecaprenyl-diphosphatase
MSPIQSVLLGIVQGLTEFLPISSSGHLVIVPRLLGWEIPPGDAFIFDVLVQVATLLGVIAYFWKDIIQIVREFIRGLATGKPFEDPDSRLGWFVLLATIPAGALGLLLKSSIEKAFSSSTATGVFLLVTAALLVIAERSGKRLRGLEQLSWKDALWIGFFQVLAVFPGVSRSGATITGGMTRNLERSASARFAFLMSIPIMLAAGLVASSDLMQMPNLRVVVPAYIPGFIAAAITGYLAIRWLLVYLTRHPLYVFAGYCTALGLLILALNLLAV